MAYKLFLDKGENFECDVSVQNASLKDAFARIVVESGDLTLMFPGKLKDGKCYVPIKRLKGLLEENSRGRIHLEVIVEDTYFTPWKSEYIVEQHTAVKVKVQEQKAPTKPVVRISSVKESKKLSDVAADLVFICERVGITKSNMGKRKKDFIQVIKEYFKASPVHLKNGRTFISEAANALR